MATQSSLPGAPGAVVAGSAGEGGGGHGDQRRSTAAGRATSADWTPSDESGTRRRGSGLDQGSRGLRGRRPRGGLPSTAADKRLRPARVPGARAAVDDMQVEGPAVCGPILAESRRSTERPGRSARVKQLAPVGSRLGPEESTTRSIQGADGASATALQPPPHLLTTLPAPAGGGTVRLPPAPRAAQGSWNRTP